MYLNFAVNMRRDENRTTTDQIIPTPGRFIKTYSNYNYIAVQVGGVLIMVAVTLALFCANWPIYKQNLLVCGSLGAKETTTKEGLQNINQINHTIRRMHIGVRCR